MTSIKTIKPLALALMLTALPGAALAQAQQECGGVLLDTCPTPFDKTLPAAKEMLTWDRADRVIGFRNDYRNYAGTSFTTAPPLRSSRQISR
ncbi:Uncharacterised protein [Raoultella terrigena]|uniref:Uncharacterized protein n=1 Tax=Raoultella terrigena TaxID=577 RepID=A0A4U9CX30_RAOTE|nr:Uncharacterised protein [Raoultella terrigena]